MSEALTTSEASAASAWPELHAERGRTELLEHAEHRRHHLRHLRRQPSGNMSRNCSGRFSLSVARSRSWPGSDWPTTCCMCSAIGCTTVRHTGVVASSHSERLHAPGVAVVDREGHGRVEPDVGEVHGLGDRAAVGVAHRRVARLHERLARDVGDHRPVHRSAGVRAGLAGLDHGAELLERRTEVVHVEAAGTGAEAEAPGPPGPPGPEPPEPESPEPEPVGAITHAEAERNTHGSTVYASRGPPLAHRRSPSA